MDYEIVDSDQDQGSDVETSDSVVLQKSSILILVDCTEGMFAPFGGAVKEEGEETSCYEIAAKSVLAFLKSLVICQPEDLVGLVFLGTPDKKNINPQGDISNRYPNITVQSQIDYMSSDRIKELMQFVFKDREDFVKVFGGYPADSVRIDQALLACSQLFGLSKVKKGIKRVMLLTNQDDPNQGSIVTKENTYDVLNSNAFVRAKDLMGVGIFIELYNITKVGHRFNFSKFYKELLEMNGNILEERRDDWEKDQKSGDIVAEEGRGGLEEFTYLMKKRHFKKRVFRTSMLYLGNDVRISVSLYKLVGKSGNVKKAVLTKEHFKVSALTRKISQLSAAKLLPCEIFSQIAFTNNKNMSVRFSKDEQNHLSNCCSLFKEYAYELVGFRSKDDFMKYSYYKGGPDFIYPNDHVVAGSSKVFAALLHSMLKKNKIAICTSYIQKASTPCLVALIPRADKAGFDVRKLPYAEEIKDLDVPCAFGVENEKMKENIKNLVRKNIVDVKHVEAFDSEDYSNPALAKQYATIEAHALDAGQPEWEDDTDIVEKCFVGREDELEEINCLRDKVMDYLMEEEGM